jgi:hypothetical protein
MQQIKLEVKATFQCETHQPKNIVQYSLNVNGNLHRFLDGA